MDEVRKQQAAIKAKRDRLSPQLDAVKSQLDALRSNLDIAKKRKAAAVQTMKELREQRDKAVYDLLLLGKRAYVEVNLGHNAF